MINRPDYLEQLKRFKDKKVIKVTTGIRRCGKSSLYNLFIDYLKSEEGILDNQIIHIRLDDGEHDDLVNHADLYKYINERLCKDKTNYVFLDEVQLVDEFQKACNALYSKDNVDLYITGSNSSLLSGELATYLTGRFVEIKMLPLSFKEYVSVRGEEDLARKYNEYLTTSSFPGAMEYNSVQDVRTYLDGIYNSAILKDVVTRYRISDVASLNKLVKFMYDNIGHAYSAATIEAALKEEKKSISAPTIDNYIDNLKSAYILYEARRYDIKGKEYLKAPTKYYIPDIGLRYYLLGSKGTDMGFVLENVVYLELIRRGYDVAVGKVYGQEVDFVAMDKNQDPIYIQVSYKTDNPDTLARELKSLEMINDNNPKYLITLDDEPYASFNGVKRINALDWLLDKSRVL